MDDNGSGIIIAGILCLLLTGFLCCLGEPPPAPVSTTVRAWRAVPVARRVDKRGRRATPKAKARMKPAREGDKPDTRAVGGQALV